jgi:hypothetical protein
MGMGVALLALAGCTRQEAADWRQATLADSSEAYKLFLQQHPHSAEAGQAQTRIQQLAEQRDWQIASAADTRDSYQLFLTQHADSKWAQEARIRIENFAQAGVSGGEALAAAAAPAAPSTDASTAEAGAAASPNGVAASAAAAPTTAGNMTAPAAEAAVPAAPVAAAAAMPATHARHRAQREHAHASLAQAGRRATHRVAHAAPRAAHPVLAHNGRPARLLQLGAFHSRASAESEWRVLRAHFSTLKGLQPRYVAAHSRSGRVYRLEVRVSSAAEASGVCASLRRHARSCVRLIA